MYIHKWHKCVSKKNHYAIKFALLINFPVLLYLENKFLWFSSSYDEDGDKEKGELMILN